MAYIYKTKGGVCPSTIEITLDGYILTDVVFNGGCNGNLKAIKRVVVGKTVSEIEELFTGITCGRKETSCSDQLTKAVRMAYEKAIAKAAAAENAAADSAQNNA